MHTPKPVLEVGGRPFLFWLMRELLRFGVEEFVLLTGHLSGAVEDAVRRTADALPRKVGLHFSREPAPAGTGGALWHARHLLADRFLLCNGDSLFAANLAPLLASFGADDADVAGRMMLRRIPDAARYGVVERMGDRVTRFAARPASGGAGLINAGIYALGASIVDFTTPNCSLEGDVLPKLAAAGRLRGTTGEGWFIDIGIPESLAEARRELPGRLRRPALLLDRDGVLNRDFGHVGSRERWQWVDGARTALRRATAAGWQVFVVTNQSGIARGFYTEAEFQALMRWAADEARRAGGTIDDWRHCPHHPDAGCACRKPLPGMIQSLIAAWDLDPAACLMIGDQPTDMQAAEAAGIRGTQFPGGDLDRFLSVSI